MRIIVCIKYVPEKNILTKELTISDRSLVSGKINPADMFAIEESIRIKEHYGAEAIGLCMGVASANVALRHSIAMGLDKVILMSDQRFAGADTYATSYTLSRGLAYIGTYDLVICGKQSTDGDTGQTAQEIAAHLDIPCLINVVSITTIGNNTVECVILTECGYLETSVQLPAVVSVLKGINEPRIPSVAGLIRAQSVNIKAVCADDIEINITKCGTCGSPTRVKSLQHHLIGRKECIDITEGYINTIANIIEEIRNLKQTNKSPGRYRNIRDKANGIKAEKQDEIWVLCEMSNGKISLTSKQLISKAASIVGERQRLCAVILEPFCMDYSECLKNYSVERIYSLTEDIKIPAFDESMPNTLCAICREYRPSIFLIGGTVWGKWIAPLVAAKLGTGLTADCLDLRIDGDTGNLIQIRTAFGGDVIAEIVCPERRPQMATVRTNIFQDLPNYIMDCGVLPEIIDISRFTSCTSRIRVTGLRCSNDGGRFAKDLANADIVLCGGRGIGGKDGFEALFRLSSMVGGIVGATRYAVDAGWIDYSFQIGQTGTIVRPKVYLNFGVSGALEHIVGMQGAKCVISINRDSNAPIFAYSHYKIVDNCDVVLSKLIKYFLNKNGG